MSQRGQQQREPESREYPWRQSSNLQKQHYQDWFPYGVANPFLSAAQLFLSGPDSANTQTRKRTKDDSLEPIRVERVVRQSVQTVTLDDDVDTVVTKMSESDVRFLIVLEDDSPVGVVTGQDVALALAAETPIAEQAVSDLITGRVPTVSMDMTVFDAIQQMKRESARLLPVVDKTGGLRGVVTADDLLMVFGDRIRELVELLDAQIVPNPR